MKKVILIMLIVLVVLSVNVVAIGTEVSVEFKPKSWTNFIGHSQINEAKYRFNDQEKPSHWEYNGGFGWDNVNDMGFIYDEQQKILAAQLVTRNSADGYDLLGQLQSIFKDEVIVNPPSVLFASSTTSGIRAEKATQSSAATINPSQPSATQQQIITTPGCNTPQCQEADYIWSQIAGFVKPEYRGKVWNVVTKWTDVGGQQIRASSSNVQLSGDQNQRARKLYQDLLNYNIEVNLAKAIVANAVSESQIQPNAVGDCSSSNTKSIPIQGKGNCCSFGLWQFNICAGEGITYLQQNQNPTTDQDKLNILYDYSKQVTYVVNWIRKRNDISVSRTVDQWVEWFVDEFEKPKDRDLAKTNRKNHAKTLESNGVFTVTQSSIINYNFLGVNVQIGARYKSDFDCVVNKLNDDLSCKNSYSLKQDYTVAYENRKTVDGKAISAHALGMAIDLNQDDNPYCKKVNSNTVTSCCGAIGCCKQDYATINNVAGQCMVNDCSANWQQRCNEAMNQQSKNPPLITNIPDCWINAFKGCGFGWGGDQKYWGKSIYDPQHFSLKKSEGGKY